MTASYQLGDTTVAYSKIKEVFSKKILDKFDTLIPANARILEIGPGAGHFGLEAIKRGHRYATIEPSEEIRKMLADLGINEVKEDLVPPIPFENDQFDLFYASMVLEHMPSYVEAINFIREAKRVLKPNGYICLMFPNYYSNPKIFYEMDYTHSFLTTPRRVIQMCTHNGLSVYENVSTIGWFWVKSSPLLSIIRFLSLVFSWIINNQITIAVFSLVGAEELLWKFRKTFFESTILILRQEPSPETKVN